MLSGKMEHRDSYGNKVHIHMEASVSDVQLGRCTPGAFGQTFWIPLPSSLHTWARVLANGRWRTVPIVGYLSPPPDLKRLLTGCLTALLFRRASLAQAACSG